MRLSSERLSNGVLRVAISGTSAITCYTQPIQREAEEMREAIDQAITEDRPTAMVVDLCDSWCHPHVIVTALLTARLKLGQGSVCVVETGDKADHLRHRWDRPGIGKEIPLVGSLEEAIQYLKTSKSSSQD